MNMYVIVAIMLTVLPAGIGLYLIRSARRRRGTEPRCGHCGYNLIGSLSDRCPECGLRFLEAGVVKGSPASRARLWIGLALIMLATLFGGVSASTYLARKAAMESAKAQAVRQFLNQMLSAPSAKPSAANGRGSGE